LKDPQINLAAAGERARGHTVSTGSDSDRVGIAYHDAQFLATRSLSLPVLTPDKITCLVSKVASPTTSRLHYIVKRFAPTNRLLPERAPTWCSSKT